MTDLAAQDQTQTDGISLHTYTRNYAFTQRLTAGQEHRTPYIMGYYIVGMMSMFNWSRLCLPHYVVYEMHDSGTFSGVKALSTNRAHLNVTLLKSIRGTNEDY